MQAIKEKLNEMGAMRKAKAEAKEEEKVEKELAKTRVEVAHEVRMAREAEAAMDLHVQKAANKVTEHERKHPAMMHGGAAMGEDVFAHDSQGRNAGSAPPGYSADAMYGGGPSAASGHDNASMGSTASMAGSTGFTGGPPTNNKLL